MALERTSKAVLVLAVVALGAVLLAQAGLVSAPWGDDRAEVRVFDADADADTDATPGSEKPKATVNVEVADTWNERYTGLSNHDSLEDGEGMLFVHDNEAERTYVMREMDFDIDIVFIGADREITAIEHARAPEPGEDGENIQYTGEAKWVLEVPRGYANETGMAVGDTVEIDVEPEGEGSDDGNGADGG
ncbi:hypothetical protein CHINAEXTREME_02910 [Halobiforma lacisalsi AJ5]|uniref:DUF192 domain-containing protein n=1 Tax=Natronobacterium lacisalsi AJ5 TaxID=358396 RepID=M0LRK3_NATLA|nr:DUF192 domain-containing protein [Halobiforma lacisalsi]APW96783.1 hypothetical protein CHINAEXTREME_02910 [Halobiforma lacisalsi AJ5]EMA35054.1 hypothetical protein C445_06145 [Halobiforma lacisalsi AJ5]